MPEGDTIHRAAKRLSRALAGKVVVRCESSVPEIARAGLVGRRIDEVAARGKYLAVAFDDGRVLVSHMRMVGSWHLYKEGERWWLPAHTAKVVVAVGAANGDGALVAVCFAAPLVRLVSERRKDRLFEPLGPDVVADEFDARAAVGRFEGSDRERTIGEALLDQTVMAGVGNIYKSEVLFAERISPFARISELDASVLASVVARARSLMRRSVVARRMRTTPSGPAAGPFAVYRRSGRPCPRCGHPIARAVQGAARRSTYYCPICQAGKPA